MFLTMLLYLYRFVTLRPGDTVLTGTPPGVGCFRKPPLYLKVYSCFNAKIFIVKC